MSEDHLNPANGTGGTPGGDGTGGAPGGGAAALADALKAATEVKPKIADNKQGSVKEIPPVTKAGLQLSTFVLWLIATSTALIITLISVEEFRSYGSFSPAFESLGKITSNGIGIQDTQIAVSHQKVLSETKALIETIGAHQQNARDFIFKIAQMILLNLFLPVLTALLGYTFGTQRDNKDPD